MTLFCCIRNIYLFISQKCFITYCIIEDIEIILLKKNNQVFKMFVNLSCCFPNGPEAGLVAMNGLLLPN